MRFLVVIPAKSGSKRLTDKNMRKIGNKTLIEIAVNHAKKSQHINNIVVSTDSSKIKEHVESANLCKCIMRGENLSGETEVFEVYENALKLSGEEVDYVIGLQPDNPDRKLKLDEAISYVIENNLDDFFTVGIDGKKNGSIRIFRSSLKAISNPKVNSLVDDCTNIHHASDLAKATRSILIDPNPLNLEPNKVFIIAEAACNHMCSLELAKAMIDCASEAGADAIKFQTYKGERIVTKYAPAFWGTETMKQTEYYKKLDRFDKEDYAFLFDYAKQKKILPFSTPFGIEDADMLNDLGMEIFKVPSFEIVNLDLLEHIAGLGKPIILSTGAATYEEINRAIDIILSKGNPRLALNACTLSYHTEDKDANLSRIQTLKKMYPNFLIGMSDHTLPDENMAIPAISVALGARMIEKHYTMSRTLTGSGHYFSLEPNDIRKMVHNIRLFEIVLGDGEMGTTEIEERAKMGGRKSIVAKRDIKTNEILTKNMLTFKRPGNGISPDQVEKLLGKEVVNEIKHDFQIDWKDIK
jgi:sialic acid synthase SpsE/CMP-2-keto-3-deoxyoctulosonic acid synthetase